MAVYGPVRHQKKYYMDLRSFGSIYYFFGDGPVHITLSAMNYLLYISCLTLHHALHILYS
jgi:hypothetical protein